MSFGWVNKESNFAGLIYVDNYTTFFRVLLHRARRRRRAACRRSSCRRSCATRASTTALLVLSTIGAIYMAAARELLTAYISLELLSFSLYILVSLREVRRAVERGRHEVHAARRVLLGDVPLRH